jgi:hypothetical protein
LASFVEVTAVAAAPTCASAAPQQAAVALAQMARHLGRCVCALAASLIASPRRRPCSRLYVTSCRKGTGGSVCVCLMEQTTHHSS